MSRNTAGKGKIPSEKSKNLKNKQISTDDSAYNDSDDFETRPLSHLVKKTKVSMKRVQEASTSNTTNPPKKSKIVLTEDSSSSNEENEDEYKPVVCKCVPIKLVRMISSLTERQKKAVREMGLSSLFFLETTGIPNHISQWIVNCFSRSRCSIVLPGPRYIRLTDDDVYRTFGLPKGGKTIIRETNQNIEFINSIAEFVNKTKYKITCNDVLSYMATDLQGGDTFKKCFLLILEHCLFESSKDSRIIPKMFSQIKDINKLTDYNLCDYMITTLLHTHEKWNESLKGLFGGPILLLLGVYVDRVIYKRRTVPRSFPTIKGWTYSELRKRAEDELRIGKFGDGHLDDEYIITVQDSTTNVQQHTDKTVEEQEECKLA